jgi:hypothetical protein
MVTIQGFFDLVDVVFEQGVLNRLIRLEGSHRHVLALYLLLAFNTVSPTISLPSFRTRMSSPNSTVSVAL